MTSRTEHAFFIGLIILFLVTAYCFFGLLGVWDTQRTGTALPQGPAVFETSLQDRISSTDTSLSIVSGTVRGGTALSGYNCFTLDEGRTDMEYVCGTVSGTSVTALERGIDPLTATTSNSLLKFAHRKGANVKVTDFPLIQRMRQQANGSDTYANPLIYAAHPCSVSSASTTICDKNYSDTLVAAGASPGSNSVAGLFLSATALQAASSTPTGTYNATTYNLVVPASIATDTPNSATRTSRVLMSNLLGYLSWDWLDHSIANTWTGHNIFSTLFATSATTTNATTTGQFSVTSGKISLGSLFYQAPASISASSTVLATNSTGSLSWASLSTLGSGAFLGATTTSTTVNDTTAETTYGAAAGFATLPGNVMSTNGALRVRVYIDAYTDSGANSAITLRLKLGGTSVCTAILASAGTSAKKGVVDFLVYSNASASVQACLIWTDLVSAAGATTRSTDTSSGSIDTSTSKAVTVTAQWGDNSGDTESFTLIGADAIFLGR